MLADQQQQQREQAKQAAAPLPEVPAPQVDTDDDMDDAPTPVSIRPPWARPVEPAAAPPDVGSDPAASIAGAGFRARVAEAKAARGAGLGRPRERGRQAAPGRAPPNARAPVPPVPPSKARRRVAELAQEMRAQRAKAAKPAEASPDPPLAPAGPLLQPPPPAKIVEAPAPPPAPPSRRRPSSPPAAPAAPPAGDLSEQRLRQIYAKYVEAKRAANESTAGVTYERLVESLRAQAAKLRADNPAKSVDYEVVVKNGKTLLKPILREIARRRGRRGSENPRVSGQWWSSARRRAGRGAGCHEDTTTSSSTNRIAHAVRSDSRIRAHKSAEVLVRVHHVRLGRLRGAVRVANVVQSDPASEQILGPADFRPCHSNGHPTEFTAHFQ